MFYYLFHYLREVYKLPGANVFNYITFRAALALLVSLVISALFGRRLIDFLRKKQVGETVRDLGLQGQKEKEGTPTMGGLIILSAIVIPTLLFAKLDNVYIVLMLVTTVWLGTVGFLDDYIKVFKKDKKGLSGTFKVIGQVGLGVIVACTMYFNQHVIIREQIEKTQETAMITGMDAGITQLPKFAKEETKSLKTTLPFVKDNQFDYAWLTSFMGSRSKKLAWILFIPIIIIIITAVSNGANITDGIDGLATGTSSIIGATLMILAYISGNTFFAGYLHILYIPNAGELVVFMSAFVGACVGFLWYNSYPAQVFMGDTGSLALGGIIAVFAIAIRKELLLPILCGIFLIENLSVMVQVGYFKYTKKKFGEGRRIFKMAPLHHHFQKMGLHEAKIVSRFWIIGIMLALITIVTLKLR
ncbi:MAG TPA: phospho-N-acetylmuramoyl-pentapeptide-transferase [Bacteroidia bacterium]|jgi:phospho-N-acetylmuramoyl-pentapeptide-transferase|nr:phospho-N-acetylmuramoyl-pentapeptide-transferase [Bacteroidia bacterium]